MYLFWDSEFEYLRGCGVTGVVLCWD